MNNILEIMAINCNEMQNISFQLAECKHPNISGNNDILG